MKKLIIRSVAASALAAGVLAAVPAYAAPKQYVVVVSEGLSPQVLNLGKSYIRKSDEDPEATTAFDDALKAGKTTTASQVSDLKGLLETAEKSGYKTGVVTTAAVSTVAPLFYDIDGSAAALTSAQAKYEFLAGAGGAAFSEAQTKAFAASGNTFIANQEGTDADIKGKVLAAIKSDSLSYALDRNPEEEPGLAELASLAVDTLSGENNAPFVLVVHDTLVKKAIDTADAPALFEQFRELNSVVSDVISRREDNADLGVALLWTGGATPRFSTTSQEEISNALFIISNLGLSYSGAGKALTGADAAKLREFADATEGTYKGWALSPEAREAIVNGTTKPEAAIRASYEPAVKLEFNGPAATAGAVTVGFEAPQGLAAALKAAVSTPAK